jgi:hypothetical protein
MTGARGMHNYVFLVKSVVWLIISVLFWKVVQRSPYCLRGQSGFHEMIAPALECSLNIMDNAPHPVGDLSCKACCCLGVVLIPCHKDVMSSMKSALSFLEPKVTVGQHDSVTKS